MAVDTQNSSTVNLSGKDINVKLSTSNHSPHQQENWPFGPGHPLEGQGDSLTKLQAEQVAIRLRNNSTKSYYTHLSKDERDRFDAQGNNLQDYYAKKYGIHYINEVIKEGIDLRPGLLKEKHLSYNDARKALTAVEKDAPGNAMLPQLKGAFDGKSEQSYKVLNSGVAIVQYRDFREFERDIYRAGSQRDIDNDLTSITNTKFRSLVSAVEIAPQNEEPFYRIVVSDGFGLRVNSIKKKDFQELVKRNKENSTSKDLTEDQKLSNRKDFIDNILKDYTPLRTHMSELKGVRSALLRQARNERLLGFIPIPGILGGRKDKLKQACKEANFTFSEKDGIVIDQNKHRPYRKTITINGTNSEDAYIDLGNDCSVKVNANGTVEPDAIFKLEKDGSRSKIDIKGDIFRPSLSFAGPLVNALKKPTTKIGRFLDMFNLNFFSSDHKDARKRAKDVMSAYNKLELIVCTNPNNSHDRSDHSSDKTLGLSFMVAGKTHGLRFSKREQIATTVATLGVAAGASVVSAGLAGAPLAVGTGVGGQGGSGVIGAGISANGREIGAGVAGGVAGIAGLSSAYNAKNNIVDDGRSVTLADPGRTKRKAIINETQGNNVRGQ